MAADDNVGAVLGSLEATFDASIARAEDEAASDLAFSLLQDSSLKEILGRSGPVEVLLSGRAPVPVLEIGLDYVAFGAIPTVVPLRRAVLQQAGGDAPAARADSLLERLRSWARHGLVVEIQAEGRAYRGRLTRAARDYVVVVATSADAGRGRPQPRKLYIPLDALEEIRLRGGEP